MPHTREEVYNPSKETIERILARAEKLGIPKRKFPQVRRFIELSLGREEIAESGYGKHTDKRAAVYETLRKITHGEMRKIAVLNKLSRALQLPIMEQGKTYKITGLLVTNGWIGDYRGLLRYASGEMERRARKYKKSPSLFVMK